MIASTARTKVLGEASPREVKHWGAWIGSKANGRLGDIYQNVFVPDAKTVHSTRIPPTLWSSSGSPDSIALLPLGYIWTRTVRCKSPACGATVPLVRQTWLCKKDSRYVALKVEAIAEEKRVRFIVVETERLSSLGFDPEAGSTAGNATCPFCSTVADIAYVKDEGWNRGWERN